jgi:indole-3-glycerol phosphate synthase
VVVAGQYAHAGAAAISVLTEPDFFDGSLDALARIRSAFPHVPLLMKDFIVDEYQLLQARAAGADACLLIAALLGEAELARLHALAKRLGLTPLVEIHDESELAVARRLGAELIGVNNRNLATFEVSLDVARRLAAAAWAGPVLIAESGIESSAEINELASLGYKGFLVGTSLMRGGLPGRALRALLEEARCE